MKQKRNIERQKKERRKERKKVERKEKIIKIIK